MQLLCSLALVLGLLTVWADTAAGTTRVTFRTIYSNDNDFIAGVVDIGGPLTGSTASTLPFATAFTWGASGAGTDCANLLTGLSIPLQSMTPGNYCVAKIIVTNDNIHPALPLMSTPRAARPNSLDAWLRMRLVRRTPAGSAQVEGMNNRLRLYMHEYASGSGRSTPASYAARPNHSRDARSPGSPCPPTAPMPLLLRRNPVQHVKVYRSNPWRDWCSIAYLKCPVSLCGIGPETWTKRP